MRYLLALLLFISPAYAGEYEDTAQELLAWIGSHSNYDPHVNLPKIRRVTAEDLTIIYYGRLPRENEVFLEVQAIYFEDTEEIWVQGDFDISTDVGKHTLLHELIHHLQHKSGKHFECIGKMEQEAYKIGDQYAVEVLHDESLKADPLFLLLVSDCRQR